MHPVPVVTPMLPTSVDEIAEADRTMLRWVRDEKLLEEIFGQKIHHEVVSRALPLYEFLHNVNQLLVSDVEIIWKRWRAATTMSGS